MKFVNFDGNRPWLGIKVRTLNILAERARESSCRTKISDKMQYSSAWLCVYTVYSARAIENG